MKINLLVIHSQHPEQLAMQYRLLGLEFKYHQHGSGPYHYSAELPHALAKDSGQVFEIYPLAVSEKSAQVRNRLGFEVDDLQSTIENIENTNWIILRGIKKTEWGTIAVIQDLDGRKIELKQK